MGILPGFALLVAKNAPRLRIGEQFFSIDIFRSKQYTYNMNVFDTIQHIIRRAGPLLLGALCCAGLAACQPGGVDILYAKEPTSAPTDPAYPTPSAAPREPEAASDDAHSAAATPLPAAPAPTLPPFWMHPPFDQVGLAIDPYAAFSPARGSIYCPLPDNAQVWVTLGWKDGNGQISQERQMQKVKKQQVIYSFLVPQNVPPQYFYLGAECNFVVPNAPQPPEICVLFGEKGEKLPFPPARLGPDGSHVLFEAWALAYPDADTVAQHITENLSETLGVPLRSATWQEGVFVVTTAGTAADFADIPAALSASQQAACDYYPQDADVRPSVLLQNSQGEPLASLAADQLTPPALPHGVYIVEDGARYHEKDCRYAAGAGRVAQFIAELRGYTPCRVCH